MTRVEVVIATYNGGPAVGPLLDSLAAQILPLWRLTARDDGSRDGTPERVRNHAALAERVRVVSDPPQRLGPTDSFLTLIRASSPQADYVAFCDQDDVWHADKLERAVAALSSVPPHLPALYAGRQRLVDSSDRYIGLSPAFGGPYDFSSALTENVVTGCTAVMNRAARNLVCASDTQDVPHHDWWTYLLVAGAGGHVVFDPHPAIDYRQHAGNAIGGAHGLALTLGRLRRVAGGEYRRTVARNLTALQRNSTLLNAENRALLDDFLGSRESLGARLAFLRRSSLRRQSWWQTAMHNGMFLFSRL